MFRSLIFAVPVITAYEAVTYWAFANGFLGFFDFAGHQALFWGWFALMILIAPVIHAVHFYFAHCLLHTKLLYSPLHFVK